LSDEQYQRRDRFLPERIDEDADATHKDEGVRVFNPFQEA
jgi:hypothetical protein